MATLKDKLEKEDNKQVVCWSNGNIFRSVTLLAVTWCEQQDDCHGFDPAKALTKENLASFVGMLEFGKVRRCDELLVFTVITCATFTLPIHQTNAFIYISRTYSSTGSSIPKSVA